MREDETPILQDDQEQPRDGFSRRDFLKIGTIAVTVPAVVGPTVLTVEGQDVQMYGPGKTPVTLMVNGKALKAELEPRVTLLDALRDTFDLTGAKRVCDRGACGACTVLMDNKPVYACSVLAIEAQGHKITTIEGITDPNAPHKVSSAFVAHDAQQCGFCTPGFIMANKALFDRHPNPTHEQVVRGLGGNFCRCGTYFSMQGAVGQIGGHTREEKGGE